MQASTEQSLFQVWAPSFCTELSGLGGYSLIDSLESMYLDFLLGCINLVLMQKNDRKRPWNSIWVVRNYQLEF